MGGGLNLYGFAGGDPVNFSDPWGTDTLKYTSDSAKAAIDEIRAQDADVEKTFRALEKSKDVFVAHFDNQMIVGNGISWPAPYDPTFPLDEPPGYKALFPGHKGIMVVNPSTSRARGFSLGYIFFHEATHVLGVVRRGDSYRHSDSAFCAVLSAGARLGQPPESNVTPRCN